MTEERVSLLRERIRDVPDFPKEGILFRDITPLLADVDAFRMCIQLMTERLDGVPVSSVIGIESRGFMFGAALADKLGVGFIPVRKPGKLPAATYRAEYDLEYGSDAVEIHRDALSPGDGVVVVDDLIATGGTAKATGELVKQCGAEVAAFIFVINLVALEGTKKLAPTPVITLLDY
ncbi:MAG: adenine phosphoribosyltransferase [Myxococcales bacterium]|jgi:adenine phosphoribosyltransferase|nr:adenine phosphoribosyltransferase [Myxococcales bacterium]